MGSSNRGVTNVKLTLRVNHPATDKMKLSFAFMTGLASAQYAQPMYQQQPAMGGMGNNMLLPLLLMDGGLGGSGSSNDLLLPLMLMGGMGGDASGMNNMLPLLLLETGSVDLDHQTIFFCPLCSWAAWAVPEAIWAV